MPAPLRVEATGKSFVLDRSARIRVPAGQAELARIGEYLAGLLRPATGFPLPVSDAPGTIELKLAGVPELADEGYELEIDPARIVVRAHQPAGMFRAVQTLRQLLPAPIEARTPQDVSWQLPGARIRDLPRFGWRGVMLDVARHFFDVAAVKHLIDIAARYKINVLHLHLTDDQGWRIAIDAWPDLTAVGAVTEVGGGPGGYYTKADYAEIVRYAAAHYITVVPEIDVPGHTNAALASYPVLNAGGQAVAPFTGTDVGFSALAVDSAVTYQFLEDVFGELAAMSPGPYLHLGGDEVKTLSAEEYAAFVERAQKIVLATGKRPVGWQEIATGALERGTVVQYWDTLTGPERAVTAARAGAKVVLSPADRTYLDMKYGPHSRLGTDWAGHVEVRDAYDWDPATLVDGLTEGDVLGVESALWTETIASVDELEAMVLPRLPAVAEVAWSAAGRRQWADFRDRLAHHGPRWERRGLGFHRSPQIDWH